MIYILKFLKTPIKENKKICIKKTFRLIATCDEDKLNNMTPAFLNRFKIIYFEDQLLDLDMKKFIKHKINEFYENNIKKKSNLPLLSAKSRRRLQNIKAMNKDNNADKELEKRKRKKI